MCNYKQVLLYTRKIDKAVNASDPKKRKQKKTLQTSYRMFNLLQPIHPIPRLNNAARVLNKKKNDYTVTFICWHFLNDQEQPAKYCKFSEKHTFQPELHVQKKEKVH